MVRTMNGLNSKKKMKRTHEKAPPPPDTGAPPPDTGAPPPAYTGAPQPAENSAPPPADTGAPPPADTGAPPPSVILHPSPVDTASVRPTEISFPSAEIEEDDEATSLERSPPLRPHVHLESNHLFVLEQLSGLVQLSGLELLSGLVQLSGLDNDEDTEDTQPLQPEKFYFRQTDYTEYCKLSSMSEENKTMKELEEILGEDEKNWFRTHSQFKHIWHIHREDNHMYTHMWILLMLTVYMGKDRVCWFVVNGVPVRYSLRKHGLLCGLDCRIYPANHEKLGSKDFVNQCFKKEKEANSGHNQRSEREATFHGRMWRADKDGDPLVLKHCHCA